MDDQTNRKQQAAKLQVMSQMVLFTAQQMALESGLICGRNKTTNGLLSLPIQAKDE